MKAITKTVLIVYALTLLSLFTPSSSFIYACNCAGEIELNDALVHSTAVFSGKALRVTNERHLTGFSMIEGRSAVLFEVNEIWKGVNESQVFVYANDNDCQFSFHEGVEYLVYTDWKKEDRLYTSICSGTKELNLAANDLKLLGQSKSPTKRVDLESKMSPLTWGFGIISVSAVMWAVWIVFIRSIRN